MPRPSFDEKDAQILEERVNKWNLHTAPRVGDFIEMLDGTTRRFTADWPSRGLQVTVNNANGSFYLGNGYMSYSGGLDPVIPYSQIEKTSSMKNGTVWFFHHNHRCAHNGVETSALCRVYRQLSTEQKESG